MNSIPIPKIYFGKRKARSQMCRIYTEAGSVVKLELEVGRSCILDQEKGKGFLISSVNQFYEREDKSKIPWQLLYEKSSLPLDPIEDLNVGDLTKLISQIADANREEAERKSYIDAFKSALLDKMLWLVAMPCTVFLILGLVVYLKR